MTIHIANASEIRPLRNLVLRPNQPIETTFYDLDDHHKTFHLASKVGDIIVSIGTFYPENDLDIQMTNGYRLRGMATHPNYRRNGAADKLMREAFQILEKKNCDTIWCNARLIAIDFYKSLGFKEIGPKFNISEIGPHYKMYKRLF
ncbi:GNAT family N-acetyltransferase [Flavobacteriales bacterium]|nr:GNAT family N-acetyltransferase [Flavobacteriales bacterium]